MEGLLFVLIMVWAFSRMSKKAKKGQTHRNAAARRRREAFQRMMSMASQSAPAPEPEPEVLPPEPLQGSLVYESMEGRSSDEGEDTCDPSLGHERMEIPEPDSVYAQEIGGGLPPITPQSLVQGVVMSEILNRPKYRR